LEPGVPFNDDHALVVGISTYRGIRTLKGPVNDAQAFVKWLTHENKGNLDPANIKLIVTETGRDNYPLLDHLLDFFTSRIRDKPKGRRLYIFLSGHGFAASDLAKAALCMSNADVASESYPHLAGEAYATKFGSRGMFGEIFLWMDCCRQDLRGIEVNGPPFLAAVPSKPPQAFFWGFATQTGGLAAEAEMEVEVEDETGAKRLEERDHGVFSALLIEGLAKCKTRRSGNVYASDVANYIHNRMPMVLGPTAPRPQFETNPAQDLVLFKRTEHLHEVTFEVPGIDAGLIDVTIGQNEPALDDASQIVGGSAQAKIEAGLYKATVRGTQRSKMFELPVDKIVQL